VSLYEELALTAKYIDIIHDFETTTRFFASYNSCRAQGRLRSKRSNPLSHPLWPNPPLPRHPSEESPSDP
jgi:hypothetical protein